MELRKGLICSSRSRSRTPAFDAAAYMLSSKMSQPVKTRSLSDARGTNSLILGESASVRLPSRIVPIWVSDPIGLAMPLRTASTPATNVVATAPMPGIMIPSLPLGAWISSLRCFDSVFVFTFFGRVGMFKLLPYRLRWECKANFLCSRIESAFATAPAVNGDGGNANGNLAGWCGRGRDARDRTLLLQVQRLHRQVPVRIQNLKASLLFALVGRLIRKELLLQSIFFEGLVGHGGILEHNGHAVIPAPIFSGVISRLVHPDLDHTPHLHLFLEQGIVVLLE